MKRVIFLISLILLFLNTSYGEEKKIITRIDAVTIAAQEGINRGYTADWFIGDIRATFDGEVWLIIFDEPNDGRPRPFGVDGFGVHVSKDGKVLAYNSGA